MSPICRLCCVFLSLLTIGYSQQVRVNFTIPQAQKLWDDKTVLGDSTQFLHPITLGAISGCDKSEIAKVFTSDYKLTPNFTASETNRGLYRQNWVRGITRASFRGLPANRTVEKKVLTVGGCLMACLTEKEFVCNDVDYFERDGGKCALYETQGLVFELAGDTKHPHYVGDNPASDHYTIYKKGESPDSCSSTLGEQAFPHFALGWKAMESGWYELARLQFDNATEKDPSYHMAYVGKMLSHELLGYGLSDDDGVSFKDKMKMIIDASDFDVRLSFQEQLLVKALYALQNGSDFLAGLAGMDNVFIEDTVTFKDNIIKVIEGNGNLLTGNSFIKLAQLADSEKNVFALQLLTHNLNPYKLGMNRTALREEKAAVDALFVYDELDIDGAWPITFDGSDIAEYYSKWTRGKSLLEGLREFLYTHKSKDDPSKLLGEDDVNIIVNGLNIPYVSKSMERIYIYERLHFFYIQLALYKVEQAELAKFTSDNKPGSDGYLQLKMIRFRIIANSYFSTYDYIYERFVTSTLDFEEEDWEEPVLEGEMDDLALASRAYYWAAAATHRLRNGQDIASIKASLQTARSIVKHDDFKTLIEIYYTVVMGTEHKQLGRNVDAYNAATEAGTLHAQLKDANFTIEGNDESTEFRPLVPLGYQFKADMYADLFGDETAQKELGKSTLEIDDVISAYTVAVNTAPLNTSRLLKGYGDSLAFRDSEKPRRIDDPTPDYVLAFKALQSAWQNAQVDGEFEAKASSDKAIEYYFKKVLSGCPDEFKIVSDGDKVLCWGGYVIIGVAVALVVIIIIIVGILCLRKKAAQTTSSKKKDKGFMFSGPVGISRQESFASYQLGGTMSKDREITPYASQTLSIQRPFMDDSDYVRRSNTLGGSGRAGDEEFEVSTSH